jgi:hypothetical protein
MAGGSLLFNLRQGRDCIENNNKDGACATVDCISWQHSSLTQKKFMVFACEFNLKCDASIEHITKRKAYKQYWFLWEALCQEVGDYVEGQLFEEEDHPLEYDICNEAFEPIGKEYKKYNEWGKLADITEFDSINLP